MNNSFPVKGVRISCILTLLLFCISTYTFAQPSNDNCTNAKAIAISGGGYGLGTFNSSTDDISGATIQAGETVAPALLVANLNKKTMWYKFTLPTTRKLAVSLAQPGNAIGGNDAGFTVYKTDSCLPGEGNISGQLTPLPKFGTTTHPCVPPGNYLIQVSTNNNANGSLYIQLYISDSTGAQYDHPANAYDFGTLPRFGSFKDYEVSCQSVEDASEVCPTLYQPGRYTKSTWHTFTTPAYFDYISFNLSATGSPSYYFTNYNVKKTFGYNLYKGNVVAGGISSLTVVDGCDSVESDGYYAAHRDYKCGDLQPNTTYTVQLFFDSTFNNPVRVGFYTNGTKPTQAPEPLLSGVPVSNQFGAIGNSSAYTNYNRTDVFGCNSRHFLHPCSPALPAAGISYQGLQYNMSTFFTFTLTTTSRIDFNLTGRCDNILVQVYKQGLTNNCAGLDTSTRIARFLNDAAIDCMEPGDYTIQLSGIDSIKPFNNFHTSTVTTTYESCLFYALGSNVSLTLALNPRKGANNFSLTNAAAFDTINSFQPLVKGATYYGQVDTFGCLNTVLPDTLCDASITKAMYREFAVADSGVVYFSNLGSNWHLLFKGDASALASSQSAFSFPQKITGLTPKSNCFQYASCDYQRACITPDRYTFTTFGTDLHIGTSERPMIKFDPVVTKHFTPQTAQDLGSIIDSLPGGSGSISSDLDYFSCKDNAVPIAGLQPCNFGANNPATKAIYRQFYLKSPSILSFRDNGSCEYATVHSTIFKGKATDGLNTLTTMPAQWQCMEYYGYTTPQCDPMPEGWYTVVSYSSGPNYTDHKQGGYYNGVGLANAFVLTVTPACPGPKYNRPYKAAVDTITHQPFLIEWRNRLGSTPAYPRMDTVYTLYTENYNCTVDTPFSSRPLFSCDVNARRVTYYVFKTTQTAYVQINANNRWAAVYPGDARSDSASMGTASMVQPCVNGNNSVQLCNLPAGTYTLVIFTGDVSGCSNYTPTIYIDQPGTSRFDHAINAYDFGVVAPDSAWHNGKAGDINPLDPLRAPSNDFLFCSTGAQQKDPTNAVCIGEYDPFIYTQNALFTGVRSYYNLPRRNLWYTFVVDQPGWVHVKVDTKTPGKGTQQNFAIYQTDEDGSVPFSSLVSSGKVDSTLLQGLTHIANNGGYYYCFGANKASFYRNPCTQFGPQRYYVLVENAADYYDINSSPPNYQVEVSVLVDSVMLVPTKYDHYSTAYNFDTVGVGTYSGGVDNFSCATQDIKDPNLARYSCGDKSLWYKFTSSITGNVRYRVKVNGTISTSWVDVMLFKEKTPGDSTTNGLIYQSPGYSSNWMQNCVTLGTYYLVIPGCGKINENVFPEIELIEAAGDFCSRPVVATLTGPGATNASAIIDCHTIATDYGEFNPSLTCPPNAQTSRYKSSWFRLDINGNDTLDVTTYITENTNVNPADIKYRMMTGSCGAMQEQSCVLDALTQNTYKCLTKGSYYFQVFTPVVANDNYTLVTGDIKLQLSAVAHADTCAPIDTCLANANFIPQFNCNTDTAVRFINYSTYGSSIQFKWDFGYNGSTSNAVSPAFNYPALATPATYTIKLRVINTSCYTDSTGRDSITQTITIPARPNVELGRDTVLCTPAPVTLDATTWAGSTYSWNYGFTTPTIVANNPGTTMYAVKVTFNGCSSYDTIRIHQNPVTSRKQSVVLCPNVDSVQLNSYRGYGETFVWNTGSTANNIYAKIPGNYYNTVNWMGCNMIDTFTVIAPVYPFPTDTAVCLKQPFILDATAPGASSYQWQNGAGGPTFSITTPGEYWVQINYSSCSIRDTISVNTLQPVTRTTTASLCGGAGYTLPSGLVVTIPGTYNDTARSLAGCDSVISSVVITGRSRIVENTSKAICEGSSYTLPWGITVNAAGIYSDTTKYPDGICDSLVRSVTISVNSVVRTNTSIEVCAGQSYTLPTGVVVINPGSYTDTLKYISGCDSVITNTVLSVRARFTKTLNDTICQGQSYMLPSGVNVTTAGTYNDTVRYVNGCDSLVFSIVLSVRPKLIQSLSQKICEGGSYTLPSGRIVTTVGNYADTMRYAAGCDSLITNLQLDVQPVVRSTSSVFICFGGSYTLPSGVIVNTAATYIDTARYTSGCDSLISTINLAIKPVQKTTVLPMICAGATFITPSGIALNSTGVYSDTLRYSNGCDSVVTTINLTVKPLSRITLKPVICAGQTYNLPSGLVVNSTGIYTDTLRYTTGCDSVITNVDLLVQSVTRGVISASICAGDVYTLPSGKQVTGAGTYSDTVKYTSGCDSLVSMVTLSLKQATRVNTSAMICEGATYMLPSGNNISAAGIYVDTLRYVSGCDSVLTTVDLRVQTVQRVTTNAAICQGQTYTLPTGAVVSTSGLYADTLRYTTGCDSLITNLALLVYAPKIVDVNPSICEGETYTLPSGQVVSSAGIYQDIIKNRFGCDSIITNIKLTVNAKPVVTLTKSNDINCIMGTALLTAGGGIKYLWSPAVGLSNPAIFNPVATPTVTTTYKAQVTTAKGCTGSDSIEVKVNTGDAEGGYLLPSAFTPNGDGKNDCFGVRSWGAVTDLQFSIFDRWGNVLFTTSDASKCWDGTFEGVGQGTGAYVYSIKATTVCGPIVRKGTIILIR